MADLHIADIATVDGKADGGAYVMETIAACGAGVEVEQVVDIVVDDFKDVRVA